MFRPGIPYILLFHIFEQLVHVFTKMITQWRILKIRTTIGSRPKKLKFLADMSVKMNEASLLHWFQVQKFIPDCLVVLGWTKKITILPFIIPFHRDNFRKSNQKESECKKKLGDQSQESFCWKSLLMCPLRHGWGGGYRP